MLPVFGSNFFADPESVQEPLDNVPVSADYVVGPGDELIIRAWGSIDVDYARRWTATARSTCPRSAASTSRACGARTSNATCARRSAACTPTSISTSRSGSCAA
jgi:protein involved in polysaccharide export with SLBB domain